jgi:hypothetical protein
VIVCIFANYEQVNYFLNRLKNTKYLSKVITNDKQMIMMNKQAAEYVGSLIAVLIKDQK